MICGHCGRKIKAATIMNLCPKCGKIICPKCGGTDLEPILESPANENDTVGVVFGLKPYSKCRRCGHKFKDGILIEAEREQQGLKTPNIDDIRKMNRMFTHGMGLLILCVLGLLLGLVIGPQDLPPFVGSIFVCGIIGGGLLVIISKLWSMDQ